MSILDRLLALSTDEDLTETTWWTDTIFRGLEQGDAFEILTEDSIPPAGNGEPGLP